MKQAGNKKKTIVVSGYYGYRNMGDDAILDMICRDLAGAFDLKVLTLRPRETEQLYPVMTLDRFDMFRVRRAIRDADLLLSGGGSLLQDKTSTRSLLYYLWVLKTAQRRGVPTVLYASGLGPIRSARNRRLVAKVLRDVDLIALREEASIALLEQLCPGKRVLLTADPVFHMEPAPDSAALELLRRNGLEGEKLFAVSLRRTERTETARLARLLDGIAAAGGGMPVFLCMQDPNDYEAARAVQRLMQAPSRILFGCRTGAEAIAVLRHTRGVVSMRLHALIFAAMAGVPMAAFNTDPKLEALLRALHGPEPIDLKSFDPAPTAERVAEILARGEAPDHAAQTALSLKAPAAVREMLTGGARRFVVHVISGGDTGGAKMHVLSLLQGLMDRGCRVLLVCFMEGSFSADAEAAGIPVRILPRDDIPGDVRWLSRYVERAGVDLVHCHGSRANLVGAMLSSRVTAPVVTTIHSDPWLDYLGRPAADRIFGRINRTALQRIGWNICVSDIIRDKMAAAGAPEERLFRIPNGMDMDRFTAAVPREEWYALHGLDFPEDAVVFGTAARLSPVKDLGTLIEAFSRVVKRFPQARLLIAGEGSERKKLRDQAARLCPAGTVFFTGWLEDTASFFGAVDANVLTSLSEGFPYAILEGGEMSCATVATRVGSIPEVIVDGETGFLMEPGDADTLTERMLRLIEEPELRRRLGEALAQRVRRDWSLETMVRRQMEIYDAVCAAAREEDEE